jgi:hypothetical protein
MGVYGDYRKQLSPPWLLRANGAKLSEAKGEAEDATIARVKEAVRVRFPSELNEAALYLIGRDRQIPRGAGESGETYAARLKAAFNAWKWAGTAKGLLEYGLTPLGYTSVRIITNREWADLADGGFIPDGDASKWARFWLICGRPPSYEPRDGDELEARGYRFTDTWGSTASLAEVQLLKSVIDLWRPGHAQCVGVWEVLGDATELTLDSPPADKVWREEAITVGGQPTVFWRFSPSIQPVP